ncbi:hypothetical protein NL676_004143 [Syzygium grande]|nr:hypothetical protein NL676_004143 [Syzygium grande]
MNGSSSRRRIQFEGFRPSLPSRGPAARPPPPPPPPAPPSAFVLSRGRGGGAGGRAAVPLSSDQFAAARALLPPLTLSSARMFELDAPRERAGARNPRRPLPVRSAGRPSRPVFSRGCIVWALGGGRGASGWKSVGPPLRSRGGGGAIGDWKKCGVVSLSGGLQVLSCKELVDELKDREPTDALLIFSEDGVKYTFCWDHLMIKQGCGRYSGEVPRRIQHNPFLKELILNFPRDGKCGGMSISSFSLRSIRITFNIVKKGNGKSSWLAHFNSG